MFHNAGVLFLNCRGSSDPLSLIATFLFLLFLRAYVSMILLQLLSMFLPRTTLHWLCNHCLLLLLTAIKENMSLHEIIYMILVAGNFLNMVSISNGQPLP